MTTIICHDFPESTGLKSKGNSRNFNDFLEGMEILYCYIQFLQKIPIIFHNCQQRCTGNTRLKLDTVRTLCLTIRQHTRQLFLVTSKTPGIVIQSQHIGFIVIFVVVISSLKCCVRQAVRNSINLYASSMPYSESKHQKLKLV